MSKTKKRNDSSWRNLIVVILAVLLGIVGKWMFSSRTGLEFPLDCLPPDGRHLVEIARPRPSGSSSSAAVQSYIQSQFCPKFWDFERDSHLLEETPAGSITFTNLIFTSKVKKPKRIMIAAHYDSKVLEAHAMDNLSKDELRKLLEESKFIGATDSAFSCALMVSLAQELEASLDASAEFSLQFVFFDGEEAMIHWTEADSLYGSRSLASKWQKSGQLESIELMILLDLIGSSDAIQIYSFHAPATKLGLEFDFLKSIERSLIAPHSHQLFSDSQQYSHLKGFAIEDDHTPFHSKGVPVLHLIPVPFPQVWHTEKDDLSALDRQACHHISQVMLEYLKQKLKISK